MLLYRYFKHLTISALVGGSVLIGSYFSACGMSAIVDGMTKITISNQSCKSKRKYKSDNGRTCTSEYGRFKIL
jgi:hypothetical protein